MTDPTPRTKAGREFLANLAPRYGGIVYQDRVSWELTVADVLAIEAEAAESQRFRDEEAYRLLNVPAHMREAAAAAGIEVERLARALAQYRRTGQTTCTVLHADQYGNPMPCPDGPRNEAAAIAAEYGGQKEQP